MSSTSDHEEKEGSDELLYGLALESYGFARDRFAVLENRVDSLVNTTIAVTVAVPTLAMAASEDLSYRSCLFVVAIVVGIGAIVYGMEARNRIGMILPDPKKLIAKPGIRAAEFRQWVSERAADHAEANRAGTDRLWGAGKWMCRLIVLELALFALWFILETG